MDIDFFLFNFFHGLAGRAWLLDGLGIFFAQYLPYLFIIAALTLFYRIRDWRYRLYFFALSSLPVILSRGIVTEIIRFFFDRPRPFISLYFNPLIAHEAGGSFPSGHATAYFAVAFVIFLFLRRYPQYGKMKWAWWLFAGAILMSIARVVVGVHWPSDVLGGAVIGMLSAYAVWFVLPKPEPKGLTS